MIVEGSGGAADVIAHAWRSVHGDGDADEAEERTKATIDDLSASDREILIGRIKVDFHLSLRKSLSSIIRPAMFSHCCSPTAS